MSKKGKSTYTVEDITIKFLKKSKPKLKDSTFSRYSFTCEKHIIPYFKDIKINELCNKHINNFVQYKLKNGGLRGNPLSPKTINDMVCLLMQIVKKYSRFELDVNKPRYRQEEISIFTQEEYNQLKEYLSIGTDSKKLGIIVTMLTGLRLGELCALKWENIDLENGIIFISKTMQRIKSTDPKDKQKTKIIIDSPKSNTSIRTIPIPSILLVKLKEFKAHSDFYVLTNTNKFIEPRIYQRHFKSYLNACGVKDNKFHTLRHTFATMAISRAIDIKTLSMLLGHTDVSFTMKRYVHPNIEHRRTQIEKMAVGFY